MSPRSFPGAGAHTLRDLLAVEGLRLRRLAHRLHGVSGAPGVGDDEEPGHDPDLSDDRVAGGGARGAGGRPRVLRAARARARVDPRHRGDRELSALAPLGDVPAADGAFYCLLRVNTTHGSDGARRAADPRAQGGGDSRHGVRHDRRLLLPRRVRRAAEGDRGRRHRPARQRSASSSSPTARRRAPRLFGALHDEAEARRRVLAHQLVDDAVGRRSDPRPRRAAAAASAG